MYDGPFQQLLGLHVAEQGMAQLHGACRAILSHAGTPACGALKADCLTAAVVCSPLVRGGPEASCCCWAASGPGTRLHSHGAAVQQLSQLV